jgi:hypothetical protein
MTGQYVLDHAGWPDRHATCDLAETSREHRDRHGLGTALNMLRGRPLDGIFCG